MTGDLRCPLCEEPSGGAPRCDCGYDFAERDASGALVRLGYARRRASRLLVRGIGTMIATMMVAAVLTPAPPIEIITIVVAQLALGVWWAARGVLDTRTVRRRLRAASALNQLPAARVVHGGG